MRANVRLPQGSFARAAERKDIDLYWEKKREAEK